MSKKKKKDLPSPPRELPVLDYVAPVNVLLSVGHPFNQDQKWCDYRALGLSEKDIPELTRMIEDERCWQYDGDEGYAPYHARRALGQLHAVEAIPALIHILEEDNDWRFEDMPEIFAEIGTPALDPLCEYLSRPNPDVWALIAAGSSLAKMALKHPRHEEYVKKQLRAKLSNFDNNKIDLNSSLISDLMDLHDFDALPLIERAFAAGVVDTSFVGTLDEVRAEFGLSPQPLTNAIRNQVSR